MEYPVQQMSGDDVHNLRFCVSRGGDPPQSLVGLVVLLARFVGRVHEQQETAATVYSESAHLPALFHADLFGLGQRNCAVAHHFGGRAEGGSDSSRWDRDS